MPVIPAAKNELPFRQLHVAAFVEHLNSNVQEPGIAEAAGRLIHSGPDRD